LILTGELDDVGAPIRKIVETVIVLIELDATIAITITTQYDY
jgi:hypothetical protein